MPKILTYPTIIDHLKTIEISFLKKWGFFKPGMQVSGVIRWTRESRVMASISLCVYNESIPYIEVSYKYGEESKNYVIRLARVPSNLGKGHLFYFVCPQTGNLCSKLYLINWMFCHRSQAKDSMYECQTYSKRQRRYDKKWRFFYASDKVNEDLNKKYFKNFYAGKPTKRFKKLMIRQQQASKVTARDIELMMLGL